jgi:hypothetical protein
MINDNIDDDFAHKIGTIGIRRVRSRYIVGETNSIAAYELSKKRT